MNEAFIDIHFCVLADEKRERRTDHRRGHWELRWRRIFHGNDFSLGGDDEVVDANGCG